MERQIGQTFEDRGATLSVCTGACSECFYNNGGLCTKDPLDFDCARSKRSDDQNVIYRRISQHTPATCEHIPGLPKDYTCPKCGEWIVANNNH